MKILFILHLPPPIHGSSMVGQSIQQGTTINQGFACRYINLSTSRTVNEIGKKPLLKLLRFVGIVWQVLQQVMVFKPKVCYLTLNAGGWGFYKELPIALLSGLLGAKRVFHFHNKGVAKYQDNWFSNLFYRMVFHKAKVILLSEHLYYDLKKYVRAEDVYYCENGIAEHTTNSKRSFVFFPQDDSIVEMLFLSNLIVSKGVFVLLEACDILKNRNISFRCTFVGGEGDISGEQFMQEINAIGLASHVNYEGKQYGQHKERFFEQAEIFVHPTMNDCQPLVILEAMQHALPVVSTPEGAIPGMVSEGVNGFLVPKNNASALAAKLEVLIQSPALRQQMGNAGREKYEQKFTLNAFEERFKGILKEIENE